VPFIPQPLKRSDLETAPPRLLSPTLGGKRGGGLFCFCSGIIIAPSDGQQHKQGKRGVIVNDANRHRGGIIFWLLVVIIVLMTRFRREESAFY
jgi:hypothetical protein